LSCVTHSISLSRCCRPAGSPQQRRRGHCQYGGRRPKIPPTSEELGRLCPSAIGSSALAIQKNRRPLSVLPKYRNGIHARRPPGRKPRRRGAHRAQHDNSTDDRRRILRRQTMDQPGDVP